MRILHRQPMLIFISFIYSFHSAIPFFQLIFSFIFYFLDCNEKKKKKVVQRTSSAKCQHLELTCNSKIVDTGSLVRDFRFWFSHEHECRFLYERFFQNTGWLEEKILITQMSPEENKYQMENTAQFWLINNLRARRLAAAWNGSQLRSLRIYKEGLTRQRSRTIKAKFEHHQLE